MSHSECFSHSEAQNTKCIMTETTDTGTERRYNPDPLVDTPRIRRIRKLVREALPPKGATIVDCGCGVGHVLEPFASDHTLIGVDYNTDQLADAEKRGYAKTIQANLENGIPELDASADLVLAGEVIEHLIDVDGFLDELMKVTKEKGTLVISTPNTVSLDSRCRVVIGDLPTPIHPSAESLNGEPRAGGRGHLRGFTLSVLKQLLEKHNWAVDTTATDRIIIPKFGMVDWPWRVGQTLGETLIMRAER